MTNSELKDFIVGSIAGISSKLVDHPADTIKVLLQTQPHEKFAGPWDCLKHSVRTNGIRGLYSGITFPMVACSLETASLFSSFNYFNRRLDNTFLAGSLSGLFVSFFLTPLELFKCLFQTQSTTYPSHLYRGHTATMLRESVGTALWFTTYFELGQNMFAGAIAGMINTFSVFPIDVIKSRQQVSPIKLGFIETFKQVYSIFGVRGFYKGCLLTVVKAGPANAVLFGVYEFLTQVT